MRCSRRCTQVVSASDACERERYGCDAAGTGQRGARGRGRRGDSLSHMPENVNHVRVHEAFARL